MTATPPQHSMRRALMHRLNGQCLTALQCLWLSEAKAERVWDAHDDRDEEWPSPWDRFIVNMLILDTHLGQVGTATLQTSSTMYLGRKFFVPEWCSPEKPVQSIEADLPISGSVAGYSIQTGNVIWLNDLDPDSKKPNPLLPQYRSFGWVGVDIDARPTAEYVFPIRFRLGLAEFFLGVLNCECFSKDEQQKGPFREDRRTPTTASILGLLRHHAPFIATTLQLANFNAGDDRDDQDGFVLFHRAVMRRYALHPDAV